MNNKIIRAGFLPYVVDDGWRIKFLFMKPSDPRYGGNQWQVAKGQVDPDDLSFEFAALRECNEELGVDIKDIVRDSVQYLGVFHGRTHYYTGRLKDGYVLGQPCQETGGVTFLDIATYRLIGRELHLDVVEKAHSVILSSMDQ